MRRPVLSLPAALASACLVVLLVQASGCTKEGDKGERGAPPPPPTAARPSPSAGGGDAASLCDHASESSDAFTKDFFAARIGPYCLDPQTEVKTYGERARHTMDEVCTTAFDGECEVYKQFGLKRVVSLRYVEGSGRGSSVDIYLSEFRELEGAYGMFTKRVVADGDPAEPTAPRDVPLPGAAAMGTGRGYLWRGHYLAELQFNNEEMAPAAIAAATGEVLSPILTRLSQNIHDSAEKPPAATYLPDAERLPGGISYVLREPLGLANLGPAAIGFYRHDSQRFRIVVMDRPTDDRARDEMNTLKAKPGALPVAGLGEEALQVLLQQGADRPKASYVFARRGSVIVAVGDEELAPTATKLTVDEKVARVRGILGRIGPRDAGSPPSPRPSGGALAPAPGSASAPSAASAPKPH